MRNLCFAILLCVGVASCGRTESTEVSSPPEQPEPTASTPGPKDSFPLYRARVDGEASTSQPDESSLLENIAKTSGTGTLTKEDVEKLNDMIPPRSDGTTTVIIIDDLMSASLKDTATQPTEQTRLEQVRAWVKDADGHPVAGKMTLPEGWYALPLESEEQ